MGSAAGVDLRADDLAEASSALEHAARAEAASCLSLWAPGAEAVIEALCRVDELAWSVRASLREVADGFAERVRRIGAEFDRLDGAMAGAP